MNVEAFAEFAQCPRCHQTVAIIDRPVGKRLVGHYDRTVAASCPMGDRSLEEACRLIAMEREKLGLPPVLTSTTKEESGR